MFKTYHRAANDLDLKAMNSLASSFARNLITVSLPVSGVLSVGVYLMWKSLAVALLAGAGLFAASALSNFLFFRELKRRARLVNDPNAVEVMDVSASRVFDIEPLEDDAPAFCFFVENGKALLLVGQWLLDYESFPSESFRVCRWSDTKKVIRIEVGERAIDAEHSTVQLRSSHRYKKVELFDATPETLQADLDRALGPANLSLLN